MDIFFHRTTNKEKSAPKLPISRSSDFMSESKVNEQESLISLTPIPTRKRAPRKQNCARAGAAISHAAWNSQKTVTTKPIATKPSTTSVTAQTITAPPVSKKPITKDPKLSFYNPYGYLLDRSTRPVSTSTVTEPSGVAEATKSHSTDMRTGDNRPVARPTRVSVDISKRPIFRDYAACPNSRPQGPQTGGSVDTSVVDGSSRPSRTTKKPSTTNTVSDGDIFDEILEEIDKSQDIKWTTEEGLAEADRKAELRRELWQKVCWERRALLRAKGLSYEADAKNWTEKVAKSSAKFREWDANVIALIYDQESNS